jgi:hypothetical protein
VRKRDDIGTLKSRQRNAALALLCLLGACLNPRPEELPSNSTFDPDPDPGANRLAPPAATEESSPTAADAPDEDSPQDRTPSSAPPEPGATSLAAPPEDAGANADVELDAGVRDDSPPDGG